MNHELADLRKKVSKIGIVEINITKSIKFPVCTVEVDTFRDLLSLVVLSQSPISMVGGNENESCYNSSDEIDHTFHRSSDEL